MLGHQRGGMERIFATAPGVVRLELKPDGVIVGADGPVDRLFAEAPEQLIGRPLQTYLPALDPRALDDRLGLHGMLLVRADGVQREILIAACPTAAGFTCCLQDVSATRRELSALRAVDRRYRDLLANNHYMLFWLDRYGRIVRHQRANPPVTEFTDDIVRGLDFTQMVLPEDRPTAQQALQQALRGEHVNLELRVYGRGGAPRWLRATNVPIYVGGEISGAFGIARDITEERAAGTALEEHRRRLEDAQRMAHLGHWEYRLRDRGGMTVSAELRRILGWREEGEVSFRRLRRSVHPADRPGLAAARRQALQSARPLRYEHRIVREDGSERWVAQRVELLLDGQGERQAIAGVVQDITRRKHAENELRLAASALANTAEAVVISDAYHRIVSVNEAALRITGYGRDELIGRSTAMLSADRQETGRIQQLWDEVAANDVWEGEVHGRRRTGEVYPALLSLTALRNETGRITNFVTVYNDISQHKSLEARLDYLSNYDELTGLSNRAAANEQLEHLLRNAERRGDVVGVLVIDVNDFKNVNDSLGHSVGDQVLQQMAQRFRATVDPKDTLARPGGDEFIVLTTGVRRPAQTALLAQQLLESLDEAFEVGGQRLFLDASIGISCYPGDGHEATTLFRNADAAMYQAKRQKAGSYCFFSPEMSAQAISNLVLANDLRSGLTQGQFVLEYQPIVDLPTRRVTGAEALLRWDHPERGRVMPDQFISLAEQSGFIIPLGYWVLRTACQTLHDWQQKHPHELRISVNLSPTQFQDPSLCDRLQEILDETGADPRRLVIEVTESAVMTGPARVEQTLRRLHEVGIRVAIDDFGTGYSSLSHLKYFPFDYLKIDRCFIADVPTQSDDVAIVEAIIAMGRRLGLQLVAEGVETEAQLTFLQARRCQEGQGYLFARSLPIADFAALLQAGGHLAAPDVQPS